jgi:signal transduction histidine kinase
MRRLLPRSLIGQMLLLMGLALLVAQLINFSVLLNREQRLSLAQSEGPAIGRFVQAAGLVARLGADALPDGPLAGLGGEFGRPPPPAQPPFGPGRPRIRPFTLDSSPIVAGPSDAALESRLSGALREADVPVREVRARRGADLNAFPRLAERRAARGAPPRELMLISAQLPDGQWLNARLLVPRADPLLLQRLLLATLALYGLVLGAVIWIAMTIARPLRDLTRAAESFEGRNEVAPVEPRGPADLQQAINAFNAMKRRVVGLLDEKDRMLGAIGHDLRTPLASLRIRAESAEPETERDAMVRTITEMSETLEDILILARTGRSREPVRLVDVAALADSAVEDFRALGKDVEFEESPRLPLEVQSNLLRRAIRNLIDNAVEYGERARVRVIAEGERAAIEVDDDGPGIPEDRIAYVLHPFERLEGSRNRQTGGAGLGLAIARAVAEGHGGTLILANRPEGGLRARLVI